MMLNWKNDTLSLGCSNCGHDNKLPLQETIRLIDHHYKLELDKDKKQIIKTLEWMVEDYKWEDNPMDSLRHEYTPELQEAIDLLAKLKGEDSED